jgi:hypothetical protein
MMVARHGMPGMCHPEARPVGYGMIGWRERAIVSVGGQSLPPQITPFPTGRITSALLPGISFLATLVPSLRDKYTRVLMLTGMGVSGENSGKRTQRMAKILGCAGQRT